MWVSVSRLVYKVSCRTVSGITDKPRLRKTTTATTTTTTTITITNLCGFLAPYTD